MTPETERKIIYKALLSRAVEESFLELFHKGKISGTVHTCIGQELSGAVIGSHLEDGDSVFSNHRCHGHFLSFVGNVEGLIAELMGKESGVCGGRGGSQHLCQGGFYSNGLQGGIVPVSLGLALGRRIQKRRKISVAFLGDGTLGEGTVYEGLNIASKWNLPLLFVLENNGIAQSTPSDLTLAGDILSRARAFGIRCEQVDTWEWRNMAATVTKALKYVRDEGRPFFLQVDTYRLKAHSKGDDTRPPEVVAPYEAKDPLNLLLKKETPEILALRAEVKAQVQAAIARADAAGPSRWEGKSPAQLELGKIPSDDRPDNWSEARLPAAYSGRRFGTVLNEAFRTIMKENDQVYFLGEDVLSPYGGAFKIADGLSALFPERVFTTPISEQSIVGLASGLALCGYRPFAEIMFGDFLTLTLDQLLNHAAKFEDMYNGQVRMNMVVRTPMGGGRGYGPTHSQSLEKHFLGIPGLRVVALSSAADPLPALRCMATEHVGATLLIENKKAYALEMRPEPPPGFLWKVNRQLFPTLHLEPQSSCVDATIMAYGGMTDAAVEAVELLLKDHDIIAQAIIPLQLYPFSVDAVLPLIRRAQKLILVEEGQAFSSFSSEVLAQLAERRFHGIMRRLTPPEICIPASSQLEKQILPDAQAIVDSVLHP